jgi:mannose-6-phosphate isomerase
LIPYPLLFEPILKPRVWGGDRLARLGKRVPPGTAIGESWEIADLPESGPEGRSVVANGPLAGRTLREVLAAHRALVMGAARLADGGGFPLLIKYLDARENLSVQVHPTSDYVRSHPSASLKSEAWIVIEASDGAVIYKGLRPGTTAAAVAAHVREEAIVDDLVAVPARAGDCHYLPSGTVHALGAGVLVAEVQTPSDTTFRLYDWGRTGRALHVEEALACIDFEAGPGEVVHPGRPIHVGRLETTPLVETDYFSVVRVEVADGDGRVGLPVVTNDLPIVWMVTAGSGKMRAGEEEIELDPGTTVLVPAATRDGRAELAGGSQVLTVAPASPIKGAIA